MWRRPGASTWKWEEKETHRGRTFKKKVVYLYNKGGIHLLRYIVSRKTHEHWSWTQWYYIIMCFIEKVSIKCKSDALWCFCQKQNHMSILCSFKEVCWRGHPGWGVCYLLTLFHSQYLLYPVHIYTVCVYVSVWAWRSFQNFSEPPPPHANIWKTFTLKMW